MHTISPELAESVRQDLRERPDQMLLEMSHRHGVSECVILSVMGAPTAVPLDATRWEALVHAFAGLGNVRVIVSNSGVTMESRGEFGGFSRTGESLNVQTNSLDLHVRWPAIQAAMAVRKPSHQSAASHRQCPVVRRRGGGDHEGVSALR